MISAPERCGSLGMLADFEGGQQGAAGWDEGEFPEEELAGFAEIGEGFLDAFSLGCRACLGVQSNKSSFDVGSENCA